MSSAVVAGGLSVSEIAKQLNRDYKNKTLAVMADKTPDYVRLSTGALGLDFPLHGGLPEGRIIGISGKYHSGKTLGACVQMSAYQRKYPNKICVFVDVEHTLDKVFIAKMTGLDLTKVLYIDPIGMACEDIFAMVLRLQIEATDIGMIIIDSVAGLVSGTDMDSDFEKDNGMRGAVAKPLHKFCRMINPYLFRSNNILILINQVRVIGKTRQGANIYAEPCGDAIPFYSSVMLRFGTRKFTKGDKYDVTDGADTDGIRLQFAITKNKTADISRGGGFITFRYDTGLDWKADLMDIAIKYNFIKRPNAQSYILYDLVNDKPYTDDKGEILQIRGKANVLEYLDNNIEFQNTYLKMLNNFIAQTSKTYGSLLDERERAELMQQEMDCEEQHKIDSTNDTNEEDDENEIEKAIEDAIE